jgi:hypothetical protein
MISSLANEIKDGEYSDDDKVVTELNKPKKSYANFFVLSPTSLDKKQRTQSACGTSMRNV